MQEAIATPLHPTKATKWHAWPFGKSGDILRKKDGTGRVFKTEAAALQAAKRAREAANFAAPMFTTPAA